MDRSKRDLYGRKVADGEWAYSIDWDAFYETKTGDWVEQACDDPGCEYCSKRPGKHPSAFMTDPSCFCISHCVDCAQPKYWHPSAGAPEKCEKCGGHMVGLPASGNGP